MNRHHLSAILWLQWRIRANSLKRGGTAGAIVEAIVGFLSLFAALLTFLIGIAVGLLALANVSSTVVMIVWDMLAIGFLLMWITELITELQRSELLSFDKLLHLPVSLSGVFLFNYVASVASLSVNLFLPGMIGLCVGLVFSRGTAMLALFPLVAAFFIAITALTHQFRGWLASLMENKRRRRNIITMATLAFVLLTQAPQVFVWWSRPSGGSTRTVRLETERLDQMLAKREIDVAEHKRQSDAIYKKYGVSRETRGARGQQIVSLATTVNKVVPLGWPAYGAKRVVEGAVRPALLATLGLALIGAISLRRSYQTTLRLYTGDFKSTKSRAVKSLAKPDVIINVKASAFMEKQLPWISEHASAITVATFRSLMRAPEAKMMLLTPVIFTVIFGSMFLRIGTAPTEFMRTVMASGAMVLVLFGMTQLSGNQFGLDRAGFRVFVLAPAARKDVLLGKNLALLPLGMGLGIVAICALQMAYPLRIDRFFGALLQLVPMYLMFCILSNFLSMFAPMPLASGSLKRARPKGLAILLHAAFFFAFPTAMSLTMFPLGIEFVLNGLGFLTGFPVYLMLEVAGVAVAVFLYPQILSLQGNLLHSREHKILDVVTAHAE